MAEIDVINADDEAKSDLLEEFIDPQLLEDVKPEEQTEKEEQIEKEVVLPVVKHSIRFINKRNMPNFDPGINSYAVEQVDEYLNELYVMGYDLFETHYLGETPEQGFGVLYILKLKDR